MTSRNRQWDSPWPSFPVSAPIRVEGGLAARSRRGAIATTWWSKRFIEVLESFGLGNRLQRGRGYARAGQVLTLDVSAGLIAAQVQGSRRVPYLVTLDTTPPNDRQWRVVDAALRSRVGLAAHLLAGDVPAELEDVFAQAKAPLFPVHWRDLKARCSCPDSANPCKHIAAVLYLFAERLEDDPWLLLQWRGRTQDEVLAALEGQPPGVLFPRIVEHPARADRRRPGGQHGLGIDDESIFKGKARRRLGLAQPLGCVCRRQAV